MKALVIVIGVTTLSIGFPDNPLLAQHKGSREKAPCPLEGATYEHRAPIGSYKLQFHKAQERAVAVDEFVMETPLGLTFKGEIGWSQGFSTPRGILWVTCADVRPLIQETTVETFQENRCQDGLRELWNGRVHYLNADGKDVVEAMATGEGEAPIAILLSDFGVRLYYDLASVLKSPPEEHLSTDLFHLSGCRSTKSN